MKYSMVFSAVLMALALSACDRPTVVTPAAVVAVPVPRPAGPPARQAPQDRPDQPARPVTAE